MFSSRKTDNSAMLFESLKQELQTPTKRVYLEYFNKKQQRQSDSVIRELEMPPEESIEAESFDIEKAMLSQSKLQILASICKNFKLNRHHVNTIMGLLLNDAEVKRKKGAYEVINFKYAAFVTMLLCVENHCENNSIVDLMLEEHKEDVDISIVTNELNFFMVCIQITQQATTFLL